MNIPDEAVEAAANAVHDEFCRDPYHAGHTGPACYDYKVEARTILEAAAPHMLADAWDKGFDRGFYDPLAGRDRDASESRAANPYRSQE